MSNKAYYIAQIVLLVTMALVIVSAAGYDLLAEITPKAWLGAGMMMVAVITLTKAAGLFRRA